MSIIRGSKIEDTALLSPRGELVYLKEHPEFSELFEQEIKKAFNQGFEKGEEEGYKKMAKEEELLLNLLQTLTRKILEQKEKLLDQIKPEIIEFSLRVCERIIRRELSHPDSIVKLIHSLIGATRLNCKNEPLDVYLAPDDLALLQGSQNQLQKEIKAIGELHFFADSLMCQGDVRIESKTGLLNYDISRELADLQAIVLQK